MWPFQRKGETPAEPESRPAPAPVIRRDWTGLPPIQRLIGAHPLTAPSDRFSDDLATHHDPSVSTEPMGHQVSAEAPAGIVLALARPTTRNDGPAMISRPRVQRRVQSAIEESGERDGDEAASPAMRPSPLPAGTPQSTMRELPAVAPAPVMQRLTALAADVEPMPVESAHRRPRLEHSPEPPIASHAEPPEAPMAPPPRLTLGQARRLGLGAPINRVPDRAVQRTTADSTQMPLAASPASRPSPAVTEEEHTPAAPSVASPADPSSAPRLELPLVPRESVPTPHTDPPPAAVREIPVDAPLQRAMEISAEPPVQRAMEISAEPPEQRAMEISAEPPVQRAIEISANPPLRGVAAMPLRSIVQRSPHADPSPAGELDISAEHGPALEVVQRIPHPDAVLQRGREISAGSLPLYTAPRFSPPKGERDFSQPSFAGGEGAALAPLVGARPLRPTATLQRSTVAAPIDQQESTSDTFGADLAGVQIDRAEKADDPADRLPVQSFTQGAETAVPSANEDPEAGPSRSLPPPALTRIAQPQRHRETHADRASSDGQHVDRPRQSVTRTMSRAPDLPLAPIQRAAAETLLERSVPSDSTSEVVQRGWLDSISSAIGTVPPSIPGFSHEASGAPAAGHDGSPGVPGQASGPMPPPATKSMPQESDMDDLANKLYDRIRTRLKTELLVARERAGMLTDWR